MRDNKCAADCVMRAAALKFRVSFTENASHAHYSGPGNYTLIAFALSGRSRGQTRCGCARRWRTVRCKLRSLGRGLCTRDRCPCVPCVSSHCVARELILPCRSSRLCQRGRGTWARPEPLKARLNVVFGTPRLDVWVRWCTSLPNLPIHPRCVSYSYTRQQLFRRADGAYV